MHFVRCRFLTHVPLRVEGLYWRCSLGLRVTRLPRPKKEVDAVPPRGRALTHPPPPPSFSLYGTTPPSYLSQRYSVPLPGPSFNSTGVCIVRRRISQCSLWFGSVQNPCLCSKHKFNTQ